MSAPQRAGLPPRCTSPYEQYRPPPGWPPPAAGPAGHHVGATPPAPGTPWGNSGSAAAGAGWHAPYYGHAAFSAPPPPAPAATAWGANRPAPNPRRPWREWYADYLAKGGAPVTLNAPPAWEPSLRQTGPPNPEADRPAAGHPVPQTPIQTPPAPLSSASSDFAPLLAAMEQRTAEAEALEPAQGTESASESASAPPSPPLSPSTGPNPADPSRCASPLDALIPPYTMRTPPPDPAPLAPRGRTIKKSTIEKRRRDAFAAELRLLAAAVPGASSATRSSVVLRARDYIVRLAARERLLRRLVLEGRAEGMGLDLADGEKMAGLLAELERELRTGP